MHSNMQFAKTFLQRDVAWSEIAKRAVECGVGQFGGEQRSQSGSETGKARLRNCQVRDTVCRVYWHWRHSMLGIAVMTGVHTGIGDTVCRV